MAETYRKFQEFQFTENAAWNEYYKNIYPVPTDAQLEKIRKKWYRNHVDSTFELQPRPDAPKARVGGSPMLLLQAALFALAVPGFAFGKSLHLVVAGHFAGIIHFHNMPKFTVLYWRNVILDDNMHGLLFAVLFLVLSQTSVWIVPAGIGVVFYLGEVGVKYNLPVNLQRVVNVIYSKRIQLLQARADAEMWLGFALVLLVFTGAVHFLTPLLFWQYTRMRYMLNSFSQNTFSRLRQSGDALFARGPNLVQTVWGKVKWLCDYLSVVERNQSACSIF